MVLQKNLIQMIGFGQKRTLIKKKNGGPEGPPAIQRF